MKNGIRWGVVFIPFLACAQMNISTVERVSVALKPDVLQGSLGFETLGKSSDTIKTQLNAVIAEIKRIDSAGRHCGGGGYQITPRYSYKDQKQEFVGYSGSLNVSCEFDSIDQYNALNGAIDRVIAPEVRKRLGSLQWRVSAKKEETAQEELRTALLRKAEHSAERFSQATRMKCAPVSIRIGSAPAPVPIMVRSMAMGESVPTESPIQSDGDAVLEGSVDYNCTQPLP